MGTHPRPFLFAVLVTLASITACDAVDRARDRLGAAERTPDGAALALGLQVPGALRPGEQGVVRLTVSNRGDTAATRMQVELVVPGWAEPMPPRPGELEVRLAAMEDGGTRFTYSLEDAPLEPQQSRSIEQRIQVPATGPLSDGAMPWTRVIRARLLDPLGRAVAEVESEIALEGVGEAVGTSPGAAGPPRDRLGAIQLGASAERLRTEVSGVRDTTWMQEGLTERGLLVPLGGGRALAVLSGDTVVRIVVEDRAVRNREQLGVGSRLDELRAAYGPACADVGEGVVVVWFERAPGMSFALDAPVPRDPAQLRANPDALPGSSTVTRWWLRRGTDRCPR